MASMSRCQAALGRDETTAGFPNNAAGSRQPSKENDELQAPIDFCDNKDRNRKILNRNMGRLLSIYQYSRTRHFPVTPSSWRRLASTPVLMASTGSHINWTVTLAAASSNRYTAHSSNPKAPSSWAIRAKQLDHWPS
jgi:hypothetical protein